MRRNRSASLPWLGTLMTVSLVLASGCVTPDPAQEILFEPTFVTEPKLGVFVPLADDLDPGPAAGFTLLYEYHYNMFISFDFDYADIEGDDDSFAGAPPVSPQAIRGFEDGEVLSDSDRISALLGLTWNIPLTEGELAPSFRFGVGAGVLFLKQSIDDSLRVNFANQGIAASVDDTAVFLFRPKVGFRFPFTEYMAIFADAAYDMAYDHIAVDLSGDRTKTGEDDFGNYSGFLLMGGFSFQF